MLVLPFIILSSVYRSISSMSTGSIIIIPVLIIFVCISTFSNVLFSGLTTSLILGKNQIAMSSMEITLNLKPYFQPKIYRILTNDVALLLGFILGFISLYKKIFILDKTILLIYKYTDFILKKMFIPILPLFIFGFITKAVNDGIFGLISKNIDFFYVMLGLPISYITILYLSVSGFNLSRLLKIIKNVSLPCFTAFTTSSSAAALPFSLKAAEANTGDEKISQFFMSTTVNIHMLGDSLCIPVIAMLVMKLYNVPYELNQIFLFALMFTITKFSGAAVPGGTILIMCPVLEKVFGFNSEMCGLITTIYILVDPIVTTGSVLGNNAFVIVFQKIINSLSKKQLKIIKN